MTTSQRIRKGGGSLFRLFSKIKSYQAFMLSVSMNPIRLRDLRRARKLVAGAGPYQRVPYPGFADIGFERAASARLDLLLGALTFRPKSFLDLGCNVGFFCFRFRDLFPGLSAVGVDRDSGAIEAAEAVVTALRLSQLEFRCHEIGSKLDKRLPRSEVVCCLSLLHHIFGRLGRDAGRETLLHIRDLTTRLMFFEIGSYTESSEPWAIGLRESLPGGEEELCALVQEVGFLRPVAIGEARSHLASHARKIFAAGVNT